MGGVVNTRILYQSFHYRTKKKHQKSIQPTPYHVTLERLTFWGGGGGGGGGGEGGGELMAAPAWTGACVTHFHAHGIPD